MTHEEELELIEHSVTFVESLLSLPPDEQSMLADDLAHALPVDIRDQQQAAIDETATMFPVRGRMLLGNPDVIDEHRGNSPLYIGRLLALVTRCYLTQHCEHASHAGAPLIALAAPRVLSCAACLPNFFTVLEAHDEEARTGRDTECDLCLRRGVTHFVPFSAVYGPATINGDACDDCAAQR